MNEYTPDTDTVRGLYVEAMRAFFAPTGEHGAEFDRWLSARLAEFDRWVSALLAGAEEEGHADGRYEGYSEGFDDGYADGHAQGCRDGYESAFDVCT